MNVDKLCVLFLIGTELCVIRVQAAACFESENKYASLAFDYWKFYEHKGPINKHHKKKHHDDIA